MLTVYKKKYIDIVRQKHFAFYFENILVHIMCTFLTYSLNYNRNQKIKKY